MLIRIKYGKTAEGKYLSHLDLMRAWERAIRRAKAPLGFSQGFNPHPKLSFGSALAVGTTSDGEYMDMELTEDVDMADLARALQQVMPPALTIDQMRQIPDKSPALMSIINRAKYQVVVTLADILQQEDLSEIIERFLKRDEVMILRFKKNSKEKREVNIRPGVYELTAMVDGHKIIINMYVQTGSEGNVKPEEVVYGLMANGLPIVNDIRSIHRKGLYISDGEGIITPLGEK